MNFSQHFQRSWILFDAGESTDSPTLICDSRPENRQVGEKITDSASRIPFQGAITAFGATGQGRRNAVYRYALRGIVVGTKPWCAGASRFSLLRSTPITKIRSTESGLARSSWRRCRSERVSDMRLSLQRSATRVYDLGPFPVVGFTCLSALRYAV